VEKEPYCREVLLRRQRDGVLPLFPIWDDVRTFNGREWQGIVDVVSAGFPCQPFSVAGQRKGKDDGRNLWPETIRVIREVGPRFALLENVPGLLSHDYFGEILGDLAEAGFDARWGVVSVAEVRAPHVRKRLWIYVANSDSSRLLQSKVCGEQQGRTETVSTGQVVADTGGERLERRWRTEPPKRGFAEGGWWDVEPGLGRVVDGVAHRVDRLRAIGNGQVPAVVREAWLRLTEGK
jgi:DNA (cytosine-5)-methyltransferase 1